MHVVDGVITSLEEGRPSFLRTRASSMREGCTCCPAAIDVHVHSRDPGFPEKEDFGTLTAAAAAGGVTTVIDMPNTVPGVDSGGVLEAKAALAHSKARVDFGLWGLIRSSTTAEQLEGLAQSGAIGFKAYLGYAFSLSRKQVLYTPDTEDPDLEAPPDYGTLLRLAPAVARARPAPGHPRGGSGDPGRVQAAAGDATPTCSRHARPRRRPSRSRRPRRSRIPSERRLHIAHLRARSGSWRRRRRSGTGPA